MQTVLWCLYKQKPVVKTMVVGGKVQLNVELVGVFQMEIAMAKWVLVSLKEISLRDLKGYLNCQN
jgi:hypothetical protein